MSLHNTLTLYDWWMILNGWHLNGCSITLEWFLDDTKWPEDEPCMSSEDERVETGTIVSGYLGVITVRLYYPGVGEDLCEIILWTTRYVISTAVNTSSNDDEDELRTLVKKSGGRYLSLFLPPVSSTKWNLCTLEGLCWGCIPCKRRCNYCTVLAGRELINKVALSKGKAIQYDAWFKCLLFR